MLDITLKKTRVYQEIKEEVQEEARKEGREEGREQTREATANIIIRQLTKRFGELPQETRSIVAGLPLQMLEDLGEAWLDFTGVADLQAWLQARIN